MHVGTFCFGAKAWHVRQSVIFVTLSACEAAPLPSRGSARRGPAPGFLKPSRS